MARKRRTKTPAKRNNRKKSDSDQNSNGVSSENEGGSKQEEQSDKIESLDDSDSKFDAYEDCRFNPYAEKTHKHPKFRYLERRHSSSNEEDAEYNTCDLMPQQIQDIVLGDVKAVIVNQDDIANDTCLQGHIEHEEVIGNSMECEPSETVESSKTSSIFRCTYFCDLGSTSEKTTENSDLGSTSEKTTENSDLVESFEKTVQINETVIISEKDSVDNENKDCAKSPIEEDKVVSAESVSDTVNTDPIKPMPILSKDNDQNEEGKKSPEIIKNTETEKKKVISDDTGRRRSNRIRVNRWTDDDVKVPAAPEIMVHDGGMSTLSTNQLDAEDTQDSVPPAPPPAPPIMFDNDKPVKVKSRWRRTSELEMGGTSGGSLTSDSEVSSVTMSVTSPELMSADPDVDEGLKSFEIIVYNIFLTPRMKKERLVCECTLSKEETAKGDKGCGDDCLNRLLMIECGSRCVLGNLCSNKQFQNCQYTPCQVIKTKKKGLGLIATVSVGPGAFLMEYVGEVLESREFRRRAKEYAKEKNAHYYFMQLESSHVIDATVKGNISRFINHSCEPNSETQKWTVNGELRIGFFSKKSIAAGEEITFDYKLDRYGREAQKCYCEASNCRGWIGETPENEKEREKSSSKKEKKERKRKEERKKEFISDREMEYEIEKLVGSGVKNQKHTLTLSRLMVRAEDESSRKQLLELTQMADIRCLRLFLDYHGLSLLWSYMAGKSSPDLKLHILNTLAVLPISNRTILQDSKVLSVVRKWAKLEEDSSSNKDRNSECEGGEDSTSPPTDNSNSEKADSGDKVKSEKDEANESKLVEKANELLTVWDNLKHEYRIPKKERMEQMKEHEREANRGYGDPWDPKSERQWNYDKDNRGYDKDNRGYDKDNRGYEKDNRGYEKDSRGYEKDNRYEKDSRGYDKERESRYSRDRKRGRESPIESDWRKSRMQDERQNGGVNNRLSKTERRQLFAMKVEEEDRQRKMEDWAKQHPPQILVPPQPAGPPPPVDPSQGYYQQPPFIPDGGDMVFGGGCPPVFPPPFLGPPQGPPGPGPYMDGPPPPFPGPPGPPPPGVLPGGFHPPPYSHPPIAPPYQPPLPSYPPFPSYNPPPHQVQQPGFPPTPGLPAPSVPAPSLPVPAVSLPSNPNNIPNVPVILSTAPLLVAGPPPPPPPLPHVFPFKLPPKWRSAKDKEGRIYYYHTKTRKSQWQIPTEETAAHVSDTESDSDSSTEEDESSTEEEEEEKEEEEPEYVLEEEEPTKKDEGDDSPYVPEDTKFEDPIPLGPSTPVLKKRREGLVEINIISPRDGEDDYRCGIKKKQIRETKEKLAREKRKLRNSSSGKGAAKCVADSSVRSGVTKRRIKDMFRIQMANEVVSLLNPFRKSDCKMARITNTEDFKFLARKLTHFVMLKELKHTSLDELECNDNVKHKARDFIRKYMSKYGACYKRDD